MEYKINRDLIYKQNILVGIRFLSVCNPGQRPVSERSESIGGQKLRTES